MSKTHNKTTGKIGEDLAVEFLKNKGFQILERNWNNKWGEIDIIAKDNQTYVFIEVKTRLNKNYGLPEESVTPWKLKEVIKTAQYYALTHEGLPEQHRIDVMGIILDLDGRVQYFNHIENVTG